MHTPTGDQSSPACRAAARMLSSLRCSMTWRAVLALRLRPDLGRSRRSSCRAAAIIFWENLPLTSATTTAMPRQDTRSAWCSEELTSYVSRPASVTPTLTLASSPRHVRRQTFE